MPNTITKRAILPVSQPYFNCTGKKTASASKATKIPAIAEKYNSFFMKVPDGQQFEKTTQPGGNKCL